MFPCITKASSPACYDAVGNIMYDLSNAIVDFSSICLVLYHVESEYSLDKGLRG